MSIKQISENQFSITTKNETVLVSSEYLINMFDSGELSIINLHLLKIELQD
jgi:hypothetical protein